MSMPVRIKYHWKSQIALMLLGTLLNLGFMSGAKASEFSDKEGHRQVNELRS